MTNETKNSSNALVFNDIAYPITNVGIYNLAKAIARCYPYYLEQSRRTLHNYQERTIGHSHDLDKEAEYYDLLVVLKTIRSRYECFLDYARYAYIKDVIKSLYYKLLYKFPLHNTLCITTNDDIYSYFAIDNIAKVYGSNRYALICDIIEFHGRYLDKDLKKAIHRCENCGELYIDQDYILSHYGRGNRICDLADYFGKDGLCKDCFIEQNNDDYVVCANCHFIERSMNTSWCATDEDYICSHCISDSGHFYYCERCGDLIDTYNAEDDYVWTSDDRFYCCQECAERDGYRYSARSDTWVGEEDDEYAVDDIISGYHSHDYRPFGVKPKGTKHNYMCGTEIESDGANRYDFDASFYEELAEIMDNNVYFETDGSLNSGFETITQPTYEKEFRTMNWEKFFKKLTDNGFRSHDTTTCGQHFHFSKWYLGYTFKQQLNNAKKLARLFHDYWNDMVKFSRRTSKQLSWCGDLGRITPKTPTEDLSYNHGNRYYAVNMEHLFGHRYKSDENGTIEIRICRGTLNYDTFMANYDFLLTLVKNAKKVKWSNIDDLSVWFKGLKSETIDYLKSRDCFVGAI